MTSPTRIAVRGISPAPTGRSIPTSVALVTALTFVGLGLSSTAYAVPGEPGTSGRVLTSPDSAWIPKQPAAPQPEAVPSAFSPESEVTVQKPQARPATVSAPFQEGWLLPLGAGLAVLAAVFVLLVVRSKGSGDDDT